MIRRIGALAVLLATALACLVPPAESAAPPSADDDTQKIVYLGDDGPVLIELHLRINDRSFRGVWDEFMAALFAYADVNRDGVLSKAEAERVPPPAALVSSTVVPGDAVAGNAGLSRAAKEGKVTRRMLAEHYRTNGLPPFQISSGSTSFGAFVVIGSGTLVDVGGNNTDATNARLFKLLDKDGDGKLSRKELAAAPEVLMKLDANDDEMIALVELHGGGANAGAGVAFVDFDGYIPAQANPYFHALADGPSDPVLGQRLLARYGKKGTRTLDARALSLDRKTFALLDRNNDGKLDVKELARFGQTPADLAFTVSSRVGESPSARVTRHDLGRPLPRGVKVWGTGTGQMIELGNTQVELTGSSPGPPGLLFDPREVYLRQFKMADTDNNGYLDQEEAKKSPLFNSLFKAMDRDGDGKLFEKEVVAYLDEMEKLRALAAKSCLCLTITDKGKSLFWMADLDKDGRLSVRELRRMVKLVDMFDRDGDGKLSLAEIPRNHQARFDLGPFGSSGTTALIPANVFGQAVTPPRTRGPLWFRKMDSNNDGDVSRKEFLGTEAQFKAIDTDGDGLISVEEAEAFDKRMRAKKKE